MRRRYLVIGMAVLLLLFVTGQVFAAQYNYNLIVPKLAGKANTPTQQKQGNCTNVSLLVSSVGGNFQLNAGAKNLQNQDISPYYRVGTGSYVSYPENIGNCGVGQYRFIQFGTDINTLVNVQVIGTWSPG
jgi:hypothetical protein